MEDIVDRLKFRFAKPEDVDFIITCIIEAEKSGTQTIASCRIFNLSEQEWRIILKKILLNNFPNFEFSLSGFLIAELDDVPVGSQGTWYEGNGGISSSVIKTSMLMEYIPQDKFILGPQKTNYIKSLSMKRENRKIQLEYSYTLPELRRKGIHTRLLLEIMNRVYTQFPYDNMVQTTFFKGNTRTYNQFSKLGFKIIKELRVDDPGVLDIFAYNTKLMMQSTRKNILDRIRQLYKPCSKIKLMEPFPNPE